MKVVHGPGPKSGSMDPWSMFCPHPSGTAFWLYRATLRPLTKKPKDSGLILGVRTRYAPINVNPVGGGGGSAGKERGFGA